MPHRATLLLLLPLAACQSHERAPAAVTADLDGVWKGVFSAPGQHDSLQAHMLDGLMLSVELNREQAHSAEVVLDDGQLAGLFAHRGDAGVRDEDYTVLGDARAYERIEADLLGARSDARLSLFYDAPQSFDGASLAALAGQYVFYGESIDVSLAIDGFGRVEAYDDAGCAYFGRVQVPDRAINVYTVSLDVSGCALAGDYGYGLGSLEFDRSGWEVLVLPLWFDAQDRVEAWRLERI